MNKLVCPVVHLNGDTETTLIDNLQGVYEALENVLVKMRSASPNARNYYPHSNDDAMERAVKQHRSMAIQIAVMQKSVESIMDGIMNKKEYAEED